MHQEEQHKTAVDKNVHDPPEKVFPQNPELEQYIKNKDFNQSKNIGAENSREDSLDG
jgi:hypothetical protein